ADREVHSAASGTEKPIEGEPPRLAKLRLEFFYGQFNRIARIFIGVAEPEQHQPAGEVRQESVHELILRTCFTLCFDGECVLAATGVTDFLGQHTLCSRLD